MPGDASRPPASRPLALVTGASSGIGRELARELAAGGHDLVLVARDRAALESLARELRSAGGRAAALACDLSASGSVEALHERVLAEHGPPEVLVHSAGVGTFGPFAATELAASLGLIRVNVEALTHLTRLCLPEMIRRGRGRILNVASAAAFQPGPLMATYYASKAYVLHFSEALAEELRGSGVTVTALCPGPTRTDFHRRAAMEDSGLVRRRRPMDARRVARAGYRAMIAGRRIAVPGLVNRLLALAVRCAPRRFVPGVVRRMQARVQGSSGRISNRVSSGTER